MRPEGQPLSSAVDEPRAPATLPSASIECAEMRGFYVNFWRAFTVCTKSVSCGSEFIRGFTNSRLPLRPKPETTPVMHSKPIAALCAFAFALTSVLAQTTPDDTMQKPAKFKRKVTKTVSAEYLLFLPKDYNPKSGQRWPLMLFLHGAGERATGRTGRRCRCPAGRCWCCPG